MEEIDAQDLKDGNQAAIEKYLRRELTVAERLDFEQKIEADAALKREVEMYARAFQALQIKGREELKERFRDKDKAWLESQPATASGGRNFWLKGFGILLLMLAGFLFWWNGKDARSPVLPAQKLPDTLENQLKNAVPQDTATLVPPVATEEKQAPPPSKKKPQQPDLHQLFAANFQPFKDETMNVTVRAPGVELTPFDRFQQAYWEDRHEEALTAFETMTPALKGSDNLLFVKANSLLATGKAEEAAGILEQIIANGRSRYAGEARWYLALAYLENGTPGKARQQLQTLASDAASPRQADAKKLLSQVK